MKQVIMPPAKKGLSEELDALKRTVSALKEQTSPYTVGQTVRIADAVRVIAGMITGASANLRFMVDFGRPISANYVRIDSLILTCRTAQGGYLDGWTATGGNIVTSAYNVSANCAPNSSLVVINVVKKAGAFTNCANNTPVVISLVELTATFTDTPSADLGWPEEPSIELYREEDLSDV